MAVIIKKKKKFYGEDDPIFGSDIKAKRLARRKDHYTEEDISREIRKRIKVLLCAYAYEEKDNSLVEDLDFDDMCEDIDLNIETGHPVMDEWFREKFTPITGMWVGEMPPIERRKLELLYEYLYEDGGEEALLARVFLDIKEKKK